MCYSSRLESYTYAVRAKILGTFQAEEENDGDEMHF
jgi:hypothetical protein